MASEASKVRIVRCPRCRKLLTEFADVPVYECGVCGTVLQAKNRHVNKENGASHTLGSISSEKNLLQHVSEAEGSSNGVPTLLNEQVAPSSADSDDTYIGCVGEHKHIAVPSEKPSRSDSENSRRKEGESSECTANANLEAGLTDDSLSSTEQAGMMGKDTIFVASDQQGRSIQANKDSCSDEQRDDPGKLSEHGSVNSSSSGKINVTESPVSEEDIVDGDPGNGSCEKMNAPTARSAHDYDGNLTSYDDISNTHEQDLLSSSTVRNQEISDSSNTKEKEGKEDNLLENMEDSKPNLQSRNLSSNSSDERCASLAIFGSSDLKQRSSSNRAYYRENSQHSEIFYSALSELEDDSVSRSLSRDSSFQNLPSNGRNDSPTRIRNLENDRMELLRKVDELRDHLTRPFAQGREGNQRLHVRGTRQDIHRPLFYNHRSGQVLQYSNSNITRSHSRFFGQRATAQPDQSLRVPLSGQGNSSCLHHHPKDWCIPVQLPPDLCCRACAYGYRVFAHPSTVSSTRCCKGCNVALCSHKSQTSGQHFEKLHCKEKRQTLKRHCRPVSGGAPFVICNKCVRLLQLPADFFVSRRRYHKLKCGGCSEVLIFLSHGGGQIVPYSGTQLDPAPSEIDNATERVRRHELSVDPPGGCLQGDPVSYSEEYGPPYSNGYSTDGEPVPHAMRISLERDRRRGKQAIGSPLHRLMGYDSATELLYQPSDEDEGYESTGMAPFYRTSNEIHLNEVH